MFTVKRTRPYIMKMVHCEKDLYFLAFISCSSGVRKEGSTMAAFSNHLFSTTCYCWNITQEAERDREKERGVPDEWNM